MITIIYKRKDLQLIDYTMEKDLQLILKWKILHDHFKLKEKMILVKELQVILTGFRVYFNLWALPEN